MGTGGPPRPRARRLHRRRGRARPVLLPPPRRVPAPAVEAAILDPDSPEIYAEHLLCAAHEAPLTDADAPILGTRWLARRREQLARAGFLRERATGFVPRRADDYPAARVALRSASADSFVLIDASSGEVLGTIEAGRAYATVHEGAIYLHLGRSYHVLELDLDARRALLEPFAGDYFTQTKRESMTYIERLHERRDDARRDALVRRGRLLRDRPRLPAQGPPGPRR